MAAEHGGNSPAPVYRVVVADDLADMRFLISHALTRSQRFDVVAQATNGAEAVEAAKTHAPDLTLLDLAMPVMDGLGALPLIREALPDSPVVVLSGLDAAEMAEKVAARGGAAYLMKGLSPDRLVAELLAVLEAPAEPGRDVEETERPHQAQLTLPCDLTSGREARRFLEEVLEEWGLEQLLDEALLLTSELVNNAVLHARSGVDMAVTSNGGRLRIEVIDRGTGALQLKEVTTRDTGGRGLFLVEALSRTWGTTADQRHKSVWFEL